MVRSKKEKDKIVRPYRNNLPSEKELEGNPKFNLEISKFRGGLEFDLFDVSKFLEKYRKNPNLVDLIKQWGDNPGYIREYLERIKNKNFSDFKVKRNFGRSESFRDSECNQIWSDTICQFIFEEKGLYSACLGFEYYNKNSILVPQIQGVSGRGRSLESIKWPNALLNLTIKWAKAFNFSEIMVLPSKRNQWEGVKSKNSRAKMYYDFTAKREGFEYDSERQVFFKKI